MRTVEHTKQRYRDFLSKNTLSPNMLSTDTETIEQLTGCCSSLSAAPCLRMDSDDHSSDDLQGYCFDANGSHDGVKHTTISREAILKRMNEYRGLCMSDENLEQFVAYHESTKSSVKLMMMYS